jgi:5-formyltetrahydrofolate cyclo-ligase
MTETEFLKQPLRLYWKKKLLQISSDRRAQAASALTSYPFPNVVIASFASFREEIDTHQLNRLLAKKKLLALPRIENHRLVFYHVNHPETELAPSALGILEPIPSLCKIAGKVDIILVPGLAFDKHHHRLGWGKGHYDRTLSEGSAFSIGIGFKEQLIDLLPHDPHDVDLKEIRLF